MSNSPSAIPYATPVEPDPLRSGAAALASFNERQILGRVRRDGAVNRTVLAEATGLTSQSIMRLTEALTERGLLRPGQRVARGRGQPSMVVELVPGYAYTFGVAVRTDGVSLCLIDFSGTPVEEVHTDMSPVTRKALFAYLRRQIARMTRRFIGEPARVFGIGISIPGFFVDEPGHFNPPEPLEEFALVDLPALFAKELQLPVWIENDGTVSAIGESLLGVGQRERNFVYLNFTHGFGGGVVLDGECVRGVRGNAGELGGMLLRLGWPRATLESLREMVAEDGVDVPTISAMLNAFDDGWPAIERWIGQVEPGLSLIVSAAFAMLDPDAVVLGGRLPPSLAARLIKVLKFDNASRRGLARPQPRLLAAEAPGDAAAIGAASLPFKQFFF